MKDKDRPRSHILFRFLFIKFFSFEFFLNYPFQLNIIKKKKKNHRRKLLIQLSITRLKALHEELIERLKMFFFTDDLFKKLIQ